MPAVQRARRRQRPGRPRHPRRARRRRVGGQRPEDLDVAGPASPVRHPHRPHRPRRPEAPGHLLLHLPDGPAGHRDPADHRDDRRPHLQRGVPHRRAHPGREPGRRGQRRLAPGQGHPRQRAGVAVVGRRAVGHGPDRGDLLDLVRADGRRATTRSCASGWPPLHTEADAAATCIRLRTVSAALKGAAARPRGVDPQDPGRRARPATSWRWPRTWRAPTACSPTRPPATDRLWTSATCSPRPSPSAAAPARCSATSSPSVCSGCPADPASN